MYFSVGFSCFWLFETNTQCMDAITKTKQTKKSPPAPIQPIQKLEDEEHKNCTNSLLCVCTEIPPVYKGQWKM